MHPVVVGVAVGRVAQAHQEGDELRGNLTLLPTVEIGQVSLSAGVFVDEDAEDALRFLGRLLVVSVDVEQGGVGRMNLTVVGLFKGQSQFLPIQQTVTVCVEIPVIRNHRIEGPRLRRIVPRREQDFHAVDDAVAVRVWVVRVSGWSTGVQHRSGGKGAEGCVNRNAGPLLQGGRRADGGHVELWA